MKLRQLQICICHLSSFIFHFVTFCLLCNVSSLSFHSSLTSLFSALVSLSCLSLLFTTLSHLSRLGSLFLFPFNSLSLSFFWVCYVFVCVLCVVVWLCVSLWLYFAVLVGVVVVVCVGAVSLPCFFLLKNNPVCTFTTLPCVPSKRPCVISSTRALTMLTPARSP